MKSSCHLGLRMERKKEKYRMNQERQGKRTGWSYVRCRSTGTDTKWLICNYILILRIALARCELFSKLSNNELTPTLTMKVLVSMYTQKQADLGQIQKIFGEITFSLWRFRSAWPPLWSVHISRWNHVQSRRKYIFYRLF